MGAKLYFYFCIQYSVLTTRNLVSIHHIQWTPRLYQFTLPTFPSSKHYSVLCIHVFIFVFLFIYFAFFFLFHRWEKSSGVSFSVWLVSLSTVPSISIHVVANGRVASIFLAEGYTIVCIYHVYPFTCLWAVRLSPILATVNNAATNIEVYICFQISVSL